MKADMSDLWHVKLPAGNEMMTLDELDAAFQRGEIDEGTHIREHGVEEWTTLGELLGGAEREEEPTVEAAKVEEAKVEEAKVEEAKVEEAKVEEAKVEEAKVEEAKVEEPHRDIPVILPSSERPVSVDLDELPPIQNSGKRNAMIGLVAGLLVVGGMFVAVAKFSPQVEKAAAASENAAVVVAPTSTIDWAAEDKKLEERQKAAREKAEAERKRQKEERDKRRMQNQAPSGPQTPGVFSKGGDKYDPLNAGL